MTGILSGDIHFSDAERAVLARIDALPAAEASDALYQLARTYWRAGEEAKFAKIFRRAFGRRSQAPLGQFGLDDPAASSADLALATKSLLRHGVTYPPVIAALAAAEARLGHGAEVRRLVDYDRFFRTGSFAPPLGVEAEAFQSALADEVKARLHYYGANYRGALAKGWRHDDLMATPTPALTALRGMFQAEVDRYIRALPEDEAHPFPASRPSAPRLDGWAVVSGPDTHLVSHIHSHAWATGVYYVSQPPASRDGRTGWLHIGPPTQLGVAEGQGWDSRSIEPVAGSFVLMPAYFHHHTEPMGVDDERICIAFEIAHPDIEPRL